MLNLNLARSKFLRSKSCIIQISPDGNLARSKSCIILILYSPFLAQSKSVMIQILHYPNQLITCTTGQSFTAQKILFHKSFHPMVGWQRMNAKWEAVVKVRLRPIWHIFAMLWHSSYCSIENCLALMECLARPLGTIFALESKMTSATYPCFSEFSVSFW